MENYKKVIKNTKFKISGPMLNEKFEVPDESYSNQMLKTVLSILSKK